MLKFTLVGFLGPSFGYYTDLMQQNRREEAEALNWHIGFFGERETHQPWSQTSFPANSSKWREEYKFYI